MVRESAALMLSEMADFLNTRFKLNYPIAYMTPYDWWRRTKENQIDPPLPEPIRMVGKSPLFSRRAVASWYQDYKELQR